MSTNSLAQVSRWIKENRTSKNPTERLDFITAMAADSRLSKTNAVAVGVFLLSCRNGKTGNIFPGAKAIAKGSGVTSKRTVQKAVSKLEEAGWFYVERRKDDDGYNETNLYYPIWERVREQANDKASGGTVNALGDPVTASAVVPSLRTNSVKLNSVKEPGEKVEDPAGSAAQDMTGKDLSDRDCANDNDAGKWPIDGLQQLIEIHPIDEENFRWTEQMYYRTKRLYEADVPFSKIENALYDALDRAFLGPEGNSSMPRLARWLDGEYWQDEEDWRREEERKARNAGQKASAA